MNAITKPSAPHDDARTETPEQIQGRIDLAASQRLAVIQDMSEGIWRGRPSQSAAEH